MKRVFVRVGLLSLFVAPIAQLLPAVADDLSGSKSSLGVLTGAFAVGAILVAHLIGRLKAHHENAVILNLTFVVSGVVLIVFGRSGDAMHGRPLWVIVLAALVPLGLLLSLAQSVLTGGVERNVTPEMEGAVFSLYAIVYTVLAPLGGFALAQFADHRDVWDALTLRGSSSSIGGVLTLVFWRTTAEGQRTAAPPRSSIAPRHHRLALDGLLRGHLLDLHRHPARSSSEPPAVDPERLSCLGQRRASCTISPPRAIRSMRSPWPASTSRSASGSPSTSSRSAAAPGAMTPSSPTFPSSSALTSVAERRTSSGDWTSRRSCSSFSCDLVGLAEQVGAEADADAGIEGVLDRHRAGAEHGVELAQALGREAELLAALGDLVVGHERRDEEAPVLGHHPGRLGVEEVAVLDRADAGSGRPDDRLGDVGVRHHVRPPGGRLLDGGAQLGLGVLGHVDRVVG